MKSLHITLFLSLISLVVTAQHLSLGLYGGINNTTMVSSYDKKYNTYGNGSVTKPEFSLQLSYVSDNESPFRSISTGLEWVSLGQRFQEDTSKILVNTEWSDYIENATTAVKYLRIPLLFDFKFLDDDSRIQPTLSVGGYVGIFRDYQMEGNTVLYG